MQIRPNTNFCTVQETPGSSKLGLLGAVVRKISSTFPSSFSSFSASAESVAALRTLLPGTGAVLHSADVPSLLTSNAGRCEVRGQKRSYFPPMNLLTQRARMNAGLLSLISNDFLLFLSFIDSLNYLFASPTHREAEDQRTRLCVCSYCRKYY